MTKDYKKIKPHFFSNMKDGAFCFTGMNLKRHIIFIEGCWKGNSMRGDQTPYGVKD
ncbi:MAG: hypothetical protein L6247_07060 [Desulfobacteraceae bacterium]|nr:hypothetical protein [Desulfobacteraceae bacterium]